MNNKKDKNKRKRKIVIISVVSVVLILLLLFFTYYIYTYIQVKDFTDLELDSTVAEGQFIRLRGSDVHYIEKGDGNRNLILIHGIGSGSFSFENNIDFLADAGFKVHAIDLKGFGYSERVIDSDHSHQEQARIVIEFMNKKGIETATLAGHSMGGRVILIAYDFDPEKFENIILIDSAGLEQMQFSGVMKFFTQPFVDILYFNLFVNRQNFKNFLSSAFYDKESVDDNVVDRYWMPFKIKDTNRVYLSILKGNTYHDIEAVLKKINIPVLIIWGEQDTWISVDNAYRFSELLPNCSVVVIPGAGHVPMEEKPEAVNRAIIEFLE